VINEISIHCGLLDRDAILPLFLNFFANRWVKKSQIINDELDADPSMLLGKDMNIANRHKVTMKC